MSRVILKRANRKPVWIIFKYEKHPTICLKCGLLDHDTRGCVSVQRNISNLYGSWLRAESIEEKIPVWTDDQANDAVMVVNLPESQARSHTREVSIEVRGDEVRNEETPFVTVPSFQIGGDLLDCYRKLESYYWVIYFIQIY